MINQVGRQGGLFKGAVAEMCFHGGETCWSLREQRKDCRSKIRRLRSAIDNTNDFKRGP